MVLPRLVNVDMTFVEKLRERCWCADECIEHFFKIFGQKACSGGWEP